MKAHSRQCFIAVTPDPTPLHCNSVLARKRSPLSSAALQNRWPAGLFESKYPMKTCCSYSCAMTEHHCIATVFLPKSNHHCPVLQCKIGCQQACLSPNTPMKTCCSYSCAVTQHQCMFLPESNHHCPVLLCKTGSQQAVFHCSYTYGDLLYIQVCSDPAQMLCSKVQGKMQSPLFSAALLNRLTQGSLSLQIHLWRFALHTGVQ